VFRLMGHYVRAVDEMNQRIGRFAMYGIFVIAGILFWSSVSKTFFRSFLWTLEIAPVRDGRLLHSRRSVFHTAQVKRSY
jgi:hypothetical protein